MISIISIPENANKDVVYQNGGHFVQGEMSWIEYVISRASLSKQKLVFDISPALKLIIILWSDKWCFSLRITLNNIIDDEYFMNIFTVHLERVIWVLWLKH